MKKRSLRRLKTFNKQKRKIELAKDHHVYIHKSYKLKEDGWSCNCYLCKPRKGLSLQEKKEKEILKSYEVD